MAEAAVLEPLVDPRAGDGAPPPSTGGPRAGPPPAPELDKGGAAPPAEPAKPAPPAKPAQPPRAAPAPAPAPSLADAAPPAATETPPIAAPANWPDDWRARLAGDDKAAIDRLARFQSPEDIFKSFRNLEKQLSSGQYAKKLPTHYTEQELADYRKANAIPDKPEDYDIEIGQGVVWGDSDKEIIKDFTSFAHENHMPPEFVKRGLEWYARQEEALESRLAQNDTLNYQAGADQLRAEWGNETRANLNFAKNKLAAFPGAWDFIMGSRDDTGRRNGDNPVVLKAIYDLAFNSDPQGREMPSAGTNAGQTIEQELQGPHPRIRGTSPVPTGADPRRRASRRGCGR